MDPARIADALIEAPIVTSFTSLGIQARRRLDAWDPVDSYDLAGRIIVVTGATSGIGNAIAEQLARCGATLVLVGRTTEKNRAVVADLVAATGNHAIEQFPADLGDLDQVRALADHVQQAHRRVDVLIHNAGALTETRHESPDGTEATIASQVVGPFLLTGLLLDRLRSATAGRVLTMSSGGMYAARLTVDDLEMSADDYAGSEQYARAKRAQVTLNEMWAERVDGVSFHAMHPGWVDTPGIEASLPTFSKLMGPLLRSPAEGADTMIWLAADDEPLATNGRFWLDRRPRSIHKLPTTRRSDTPERRARLWRWVSDAAGLDPGD